MGKYAHGGQYQDRTTKSTFRKGGTKTLIYLYFAYILLHFSYEVEKSGFF